jgi:hypothetical protein
MKCHFGKHKGEEIGDIPTGYLKWAVANVTPRPAPQYQFQGDGVTPLTTEQVDAMEKQTRDFLNAAEGELATRSESDG